MCTKASQQRIEALRRKLSNQPTDVSPTPEVPGAPMMSQASGAYSAGNPLPTTPQQPPYGRYHPRENDVVSPAPGDTLPDTLPSAPEAPFMEMSVEPAPADPAQAGLTTPVATAPAPSPGEEDVDDSVSTAAEMPPPSNPYWKCPVSTRSIFMVLIKLDHISQMIYCTKWGYHINILVGLLRIISSR